MSSPASVTTFDESFLVLETHTQRDIHTDTHTDTHTYTHCLDESENFHFMYTTQTTAEV